MTAGTWWATPARPDRWFSEAELDASPSAAPVVAHFVARAAASALVLTVAQLVVARLDVVRVVVLAVAVLAVGLVLAGRAGRRETRYSEVAGPAAGAPTTVDRDVAELATALGVGAVAVSLRSSSCVEASVAGGAGIARLALTSAVEDRPASIRRWVIAHELAHVAAGDLARRRVHHAVVAVGTAALLVGSRLGSPSWPSAAAAAVAFAVVVGLWIAWSRRAQERRADLAAVRLVDVPAEQLRPVVAGTDTPLAPGPIARAVSPHPAPAERLEFVARARPGFAPRSPGV